MKSLFSIGMLAMLMVLLFQAPTSGPDANLGSGSVELTVPHPHSGDAPADIKSLDQVDIHPSVAIYEISNPRAATAVPVLQASLSEKPDKRAASARPAGNRLYHLVQADGGGAGEPNDEGPNLSIWIILGAVAGGLALLWQLFGMIASLTKSTRDDEIYNRFRDLFIEELPGIFGVEGGELKKKRR